MKDAYQPTHPCAGTDPARQRVGNPGHCERGDVGCGLPHAPLRRVYVYELKRWMERWRSDKRKRPAYVGYYTTQGDGACIHDVPERHSAETTKTAAIREHREKCADRVTR